MKITVIAVGRLKSPFIDDIAHYERLLSRYAKFEIVELKESSQIVKQIPSGAFVSLLDAGGESYGSVAFSRFISGRQLTGKDLCFVIGGPFGFTEGDPGRCDHRLSLGRMTLPHQLARVVLVEQIYRAHKILAGEPYHY